MAEKLEGKHILLVEDDELVAFTMEEMLLHAKAGSVAWAPDVETALKVLADRNFDVGIVDVNLHREFSWPVAERLRELSVPYVTVSGYGTSLEHPLAGTVLAKPYSMRQLLDAVASLLP